MKLGFTTAALKAPPTLERKVMILSQTSRTFAHLESESRLQREQANSLGG
jgi:hypothetical protein